jgi:hypothetical protein
MGLDGSNLPYKGGFFLFLKGGWRDLSLILYKPIVIITKLTCDSGAYFFAMSRAI